MQKIVGLFGGTFDPVHNGHTHTISYLLGIIPFEKILVIPNLKPPHREKLEVSFDHRYKMVSLAFKDIERTVVDNRESLRPGPSYSIDTVKDVITEEGNAKVIFIIGSDSFEDFPTWYKWEELIKLVDFIVMKRPEHKLSKRNIVYDLLNKINSVEGFLNDFKKKNFLEVEVIPLKISSSLVRKNISNGKEIEDLVNPSVNSYLKENGLYGPKKSS